jgi:hypothetical protein
LLAITSVINAGCISLKQLRIRDLETALQTEKAEKADALTNVERLSESVQ